MLRKIRTLLALVSFTLITLLLLDFTGTLHRWLGWLARVQVMPAILAFNVVVLVILAIVTLLLGRIYCSVVCPLGIMQDIISRLRGKKAQRRFSYSREKRWLRYIVLAIYVVAVILGVGVITALLDPYGAYGRIAQNLLQPLYKWGNNALAAIAEHYESYAFYSTEVWIRSLPTFIVAAVTLVAVGVLAWRNGRTYCNTICPVGSLLGLLSRFAIFKVRINKSKCISCGSCARRCKASCIDSEHHQVDYSRCVVCGDCIDACSVGALTYCAATPSDEPAIERPIAVDENKRAFLVGGAVAISAAALAQARKKRDGGLAIIEDKKEPERETPILPPGALNARHFARHCTACQLCVAQCPNGVLRPSGDALTLMQPVMGFDHGYCRPECNRCGHVCPTGAIQLLTHDEKVSTRIGHAVTIRENCLPHVSRDDNGNPIQCGNCARHCPNGAIMMVEDEEVEGAMVPIVNAAKCIGCGACEYVCPARPLGGIYVEGHDTHQLA
ncbi:MAG: 4Fe-4S binding protein [Muribaculaceae bacterium]|nr:4Fe-4S binding protein [Muribaculaceae bacterium]